MTKNSRRSNTERYCEFEYVYSGVYTSVGHRFESFDISKYRTFDISYRVFSPPSAGNSVFFMHTMDESYDVLLYQTSKSYRLVCMFIGSVSNSIPISISNTTVVRTLVSLAFSCLRCTMCFSYHVYFLVSFFP